MGGGAVSHDAAAQRRQAAAAYLQDASVGRVTLQTPWPDYALRVRNTGGRTIIATIQWGAKSEWLFGDQVFYAKWTSPTYGTFSTGPTKDHPQGCFRVLAARFA